MGEQKRVCGKCRACCTALQVEMADGSLKPEWKRCAHLGVLGCKVYSKRPLSCASFRCGWLQGMGGREDRPDRLGVIITPVTTEGMGEHAMVHEMHAGAMQKPRVRLLLGELVKHTIVFHIRGDSMRRLIGGPPERLGPLMEKAHAAGVLTVNGEQAAPDVPLADLLAKHRRPA